MKTTEYGKDARAKLSSGVNELSKAVKSTLGPAGRNVLIKLKDKKPFSTKDGVTVAGAFGSSDPIKQVAIEAVQEVSQVTDEKTGDGTTTASVLAQYILKKGLDFPKGLNLLDIKKGIDLCSLDIIKKLKELALECQDEEMLKKVALVSSNYDEEVSDAVIEAFRYSGKQGIVNIKRSRDSVTKVFSVKGMTYPCGYRSRDFINDYENEICEFKDALVLITNKKIITGTSNLDFLYDHCSKNDIPLLIICKDMDIMYQNMIIQNKRSGAIKVCVVRAPGFGNEQEDLLYDLGVSLGKTPFIENKGLDFDKIDKDSLISYLPIAEKVFVSEQTMSVHASDEYTNQMEARADILRSKLDEYQNAYEKSQVQARISRLTNGIAIISIGANTDIEFVEKQHRIQDALYAVKSANNEGIVPGGGAALFSISQMINKPKNKSKAYGYQIMIEAIKMPLIQICYNAGKIIHHENIPFWQRVSDFFMKSDEDYIDESKVDVMLHNFNYGFNVLTEEVEDMITSNVIDPVKVTRVAVENAASISGLLLTTECVIIDNNAYAVKEYYNE